MNFYKDPLLEKLRLIESRVLSEGLSDEEWAELKQLRGELDKDSDSAKLHADADALLKSKEPVSPTIDPNKPPVDPNKKKPRYPVNPGTRALQHWLNSKGFKVTVDGAPGPQTKAATQAYFDKYIAAGKADKATSDEFEAMHGVGVSYNVRPTKTDTEGYMWIGSKRYLEAMNKYGYDPKTGNPVGGARPPGQSGQPTPAAPTKPAPTPPTPAAPEKPKEVSTGNPALDVLNKVPNPTNNMEYWVNGSRYSYTNAGFDPQTGQPHPANGWYKNLDPSDKLQWNANRALSSRGYTGPDEDGAKTQFLANYKQPTATAESSELDRLKQLLKF